MNVNLGAPYEHIVQKVIEKGYAGNQTEVIRQALLAYSRDIEEEEVFLVHKGVKAEMAEIRSGKTKSIPLSKILSKYRK